MLIHESDGQSGGLLMMWTSDISIQEQGISKNFIDVVIDNGVPNWRFIGLYGESEWSQKSVTWDALHSIRGDGSIPWLMGTSIKFCSMGRRREEGQEPNDSYKHSMMCYQIVS
jgi:hypothetical protein